MEVLLHHYPACRPVQHGFKAVLAAAESAGRLLSLETLQKVMKLNECPRSLTMEQAASCGRLIPGSELSEPELRDLIPTLQDYALPLAMPCVIL